MIKINMEKAKEITKAYIRDQREPVFATLDIQYMRASEEKDEAEMQAVVAMKQILRDLPADSRIDAAKTPDELEHLARNSVKEAMGE